MAKNLFVTFDGAGTDRDGVSVDYLVATLTAVQDAARIVADDLAIRSPNAAKQPNGVADVRRSMRLVSTRKGSFAAELKLESATDSAELSDEFHSRALDALLKWDGYGDSDLPGEAVRILHGTHRELPMDVKVWLGDAETPRMVEIKRVVHAVKTASEPESAVLYGWLKEVNWARRTAQLHRYGDEGYVSLRFAEPLDREMVRLATRYVEVRGVGKFNDAGDWTTVHVDAVSAADTGGKPFDLDAFLNDPNPKIFRSEDVIRASEPFDVDAFNRSIREGRNV